jgi:hypothetical protein
MPTKTKPQPPTKPAVNATHKALLAYHSELQKYHEKLREWEALLSKRNKELIEARDAFEEMVNAVDEDEEWGFEFDEEEGECECGPSEAIDGCPCETCCCWRYDNPAAMRVHSKEAKPPVVAGDEVQWLEKLFDLKDKRRKK